MLFNAVRSSKAASSRRYLCDCHHHPVPTPSLQLPGVILCCYVSLLFLHCLTLLTLVLFIYSSHLTCYPLIRLTVTVIWVTGKVQRVQRADAACAIWGGHRWKEQWDVYALLICTLTFSFYKLYIFPFFLIKDNHMHLLQVAADEWKRQKQCGGKHKYGCCGPDVGKRVTKCRICTIKIKDADLVKCRKTQMIGGTNENCPSY